MKHTLFLKWFLVSILVMGIFLPINQAHSTWINIMTEYFTNSWGSWPWYQSGNYWIVLPTSGYRWGIAPNYTHYNFEPYQSIWCAGLFGSQISDLEPFIDPYPNNLNTKAIWGPFSLRNAAAAECTFWYWNDTQQTQDYLLWGAALDQYANVIYEGGRHSGPNATGNWANAVINFDSLTTPTGQPFSVLGQPNVWLVFLFHSNSSIQTTWGGFVDDIALGYDDGLFDLATITTTFYNPEDTSVAGEIFEGQEYLIALNWRCEGEGETPEFNIVCEIDDEIWHQERTTAIGNQQYITYLDSLWSSSELGEHNMSWIVDADNEIEETYENNNSDIFPFEVVQFDSAPTIEILRPTFGDTAVASEGFWIKWEAYDRESNAQIYLYYDPDSTGQNGYLINMTTQIFEDTSPDSFWWDTSNFPNGSEYYVYGEIMDFYNAVVYDYSDAPLYIRTVSGISPSGNTIDKFALKANFPNPFNASTTIEFDTPEKAIVELNVYDIEGRLIENLASGEVSAGKHYSVWNADVSSGIYFYRIKLTGVNSGKVFSSSRKMLLVR